MSTPLCVGHVLDIIEFLADKYYLETPDVRTKAQASAFYNDVKNKFQVKVGYLEASCMYSWGQTLEKIFSLPTKDIAKQAYTELKRIYDNESGSNQVEQSSFPRIQLKSKGISNNLDFQTPQKQSNKRYRKS